MTKLTVYPEKKVENKVTVNVYELSLAREFIEWSKSHDGAFKSEPIRTQLIVFIKNTYPTLMTGNIGLYNRMLNSVEDIVKEQYEQL